MKNTLLLSVAIVALLGQIPFAQRIAPTVASPDAPTSSSFRIATTGDLQMNAVAVDGAGNIYVVGASRGGLPAENAEMPKKGTLFNAFVSKFDPTGRPLWSSYVGGRDNRAGTILDPGGDYAYDIAVDPAGQAVIVGRTTTRDFPVVNAFQQVAQATDSRFSDGFVAKLSSDGKRLIYSSYFGGPDGDSRLAGVAVGPAGEAWIGGSSTSKQLATQFDVSNPDSNRVVVLKLNPVGGVVWSTRMSGLSVTGFAVDGLGQAHIAATCSVVCRPFVAKLSTSGSQQLYRERVDGNDPLRLSVNSRNEIVVSGFVSGSSAATTQDTWPSEWGLAGSGSVGVLDASGRMTSLNRVSADSLSSSDVWAVASGEGLVVAFNTRDAALPTERALVQRHIDGPIYVSDDRAATWTNIGGPAVAKSMQIDQRRDDLYIFGTSSYRSADGGRTWARDAFGQFFAIDPRQPEVQWSSTGFGTTSKRVNGGAWAAVGAKASDFPAGANTIYSLAVSPHDGRAWVGGDFGVEVIEESGSAYRLESAGLPGPRFDPRAGKFSPPYRFAFDPVDPNVVYTGLLDGLFVRRSSESGWVLLTSQLGDPRASSSAISSLAVDPGDGRILLIGRPDGLFRSVDGGGTWEAVIPGQHMLAILPDTNIPGVFYAAGGGDFIYRSTDHGRTWQPASRGFESRFIPDALAMSARTSRLYVSGNGLDPLPFIMSVTPAGATSTRVWATYLENGTVRDVAMSAAGTTVVLLRTALHEGAIIQIGR